MYFASGTLHGELVQGVSALASFKFSTKTIERVTACQSAKERAIHVFRGCLTAMVICRVGGAGVGRGRGKGAV